MSISQRPPLNGRNIAEFYVASETAKRSTLREYAKPPEQQQARVIMYDPIRRVLAEYFGGGRADAVLDRTVAVVEQPRFENAAFYETWRKSNRAALEHLRRLDLGGTFDDVRAVKAAIEIGGLTVNSTTDFYATYVPLATNAKRRRVAVIIDPSGIKTSHPEKRKTWIDIEGEVARRAAAERGVDVDEVITSTSRGRVSTVFAAPKHVYGPRSTRLASGWSAIGARSDSNDSVTNAGVRRSVP